MSHNSKTVLVPDELTVHVVGSEKSISFVNGFEESLTVPLTDEFIRRLEFIAQSARVALLG